MAVDDWIRMRSLLTTHPKVLTIAAIIGESPQVGKQLSTGFNGPLDEIVTPSVTRDVTLAALLRVWSAGVMHTTDGNFVAADLKTIDLIAEVPGFGAAMQAVGWATYDKKTGIVTLPNFIEWNSPAKNGARSPHAEAQRRYRLRQREKRDAESDITSDITRDITENHALCTARDTEREREIENKKAPVVPKNSNGEFARFWDAYPKRRGRKPGKNKAAELFGKLSSEDQTLATKAAAHYASDSRVQEGFSRDAERFLRNDWWREWIAEVEINRVYDPDVDGPYQP